MATTYTVKCQPVVDTLSAEKMTLADGTTIPTLIGKNITAAQAATLITMSNSFPSGNWAIIAQYAGTLTVQPSTDQLNAILLYFLAINTSVNTGTVETAILAL